MANYVSPRFAKTVKSSKTAQFFLSKKSAALGFVLLFSLHALFLIKGGQTTP